MRPLDTSAEAEKVYFALLRKLTPVQRINMGVDLWKTGDSLQRVAVRRDFPLATEEEIRFQIAVRRFGREIAGKAFRNL